MSTSLVPVYAPAVAQTGLGDAVFISIDEGANFLQVMQTNNMQYAGQKINFEDVTTTTSENGVLESMPTTQDPGNFNFDVVFNPSDPGQLALSAAYDARTKLVVKHVYKAQPGYTSGPIKTFRAWVAENPNPGSDVTKATKMSVSMKITGTITTTPAVEV